MAIKNYRRIVCTNNRFKKEIDRLSEENNNVKTIDSSHQELNGKLQSENKYLKEKIAAYQEQLRKAGL